MNNPESEAVARHYDAPESQMAAVIYDGHMHLGYWDEANEGGDYALASSRLTQIMVGKARIAAGERFCDLGCGVGMPAIALAKATGCHVEGLTVSAFQQREATQRAQAEGVAERVRFTLANVLDHPFPDAGFDGGWFFESIFHMGHKGALAAAARALKPGAHLVIADLTLKPDVADDFIEYAKHAIHADFVARDGYAQLLDAAGFDLVEIDDITPYVMPQLVPKTQQTIEQHRDNILATLGEDIIRDTLAVYQRMSDNLDYVLVTARRR
jgi:cyclopropane fatty-acyl-phospholipid synthase-like methyltransferase